MNLTEDDQEGDGSPVLTSLPYFDSIRLNTTGDVAAIRRAATEKLDWVKTSDGNEIPICHVPAIAGMTLTSLRFPEINGYQEQASVMLAFQHLNTGDGSVVPEVTGLDERCPIRFTYELLDNEFSRPLTAQHTIDLLGRPEASFEERKPCTFFGARNSPNSIPMAILTGVNDYLQVAATPNARSLDDLSQFPLFARSYPNQIGEVEAMVSFLGNQLDAKHCVVMNENNEYGNAYADDFRAAVERLGVDIKVLQIPFERDDRTSQRKAVERLKDSGYRYIYLTTAGLADRLENIIEDAVELGVAGVPTHAWFLHRAVQELITGTPFKKGSPMHVVFRGHGFVAPVDFNNPATDEYIKQIQELKNAEDLQYINSFFQPIFETRRGSPAYAAAIEPIESGEFLDNLISQAESDITTSEAFYYDAVIALGLATCDAYARVGSAFTGKDQFQSILTQSFRGATGSVNFLNTGTRDQTSFTYAAFTTFETEYNDTHAIIDQAISRTFSNGEWTRVNDFLFTDGLPNAPADLPPAVIDDNTISPAIRGISLTMYGIILLMVAGFASWTIANIDKRVVTASQPFFLFTLLTGVVILASSIIPVNIDHSVASLDGCVIACNSSIWLVSVGFCVTFSALFTKNYRINRILKQAQKLRRVKLSVRDTLVPMVTLLLGNSLVLALMTALAPIDYVTVVQGYDAFTRPDDLFSRCSFEDEQLPYIIALAVINGGCLLYAIFQAYEARNLAVEFSESIYIFQALTLILFVFSIGVPVMMLARDNANSHTFVACAIIFVMCCSILSVMFVPKMQYVREQKKRTLDPGSSASSLSALNSEGPSLKRMPSSRGSVVHITGMEGLQVFGAQTKEELLEQSRDFKTKMNGMEARILELEELVHSQSGPGNPRRTMETTPILEEGCDEESDPSDYSEKVMSL